jgi:opacity protein-like surface antigen
MLRYAITAFAFLLSFTTAQAEEGQSYIGVSSILSGYFEADSSEFYDNEVNSGSILTYGRGIQDNIDLEFSYVRHLDLNIGEGYFVDELAAIEVAALIRTQENEPFFRIGYSHAEQSISSDTLDNIDSDIDDGGLIYGAGIDFAVSNNAGKLRLEYTLADYDGSKLHRVAVGSFINF